VEYAPSVPFMQYAPNDPYQTPDFLPDGYAVPPWYNNPGIPLPGVLPGDAMVNFLAFPAPANWPGIVTGSGLPRARMYFSGSGEIEIEFVKVIQGGYALVTVDDNPASQKVVDLTSISIIGISPLEDLFNVVIEGELASTTVLEIDIGTPGDHHLDITFLPKVDEDVLLGFGGGIRRFSLCGFNQEGETVVPQFRTINDGCELQWRPNPDAPWTTLSTELCGEDGEDGEDTTINAANWRDSSCQLQVLQAGVWTNITGASYMRKQADCPFIGGVEINPPTGESGLVIDLPTGSSGVIQQGRVNGAIRQTITNTGTYSSALSPYIVNFGAAQAGFNMNQSGIASTVFHENSGANPTLNIGFSAEPYAHRLWQDRAQIRQQVSLIRKTATAIDREVLSMVGSWPTNTDATREGRAVFNVHNWTGGHEALRISSDNTLAKIGVFGATGDARITVAGDCLGNEALKALLDALDVFGWINDTTTLGTIPEPDPEDPAIAAEAFRCRVAAGAVAFLIRQMYAEAIDALINTLPPDVDNVIRARLVFQESTGQEFADWYNDMFSFYAGDTGAINDHLDELFERVDEIAQLYYCALDPDGTLQPLGRDQFLLSLQNDTTLDSVDADFFFTFVDNFGLAAFAAINAQGYFYANPAECAFEECVSEEEWHMGFYFPDGSHTTEFEFDNANYSSGTGWTQNSQLAPLVVTNDKRITRAVITAVCAVSDTLTISLYDLFTNGFLAQVSEVYPGGDGIELAYDMVGTEGLNGIEVRMNSSSPVVLLDICLRGTGTSASGGQSTEECI